MTLRHILTRHPGLVLIAAGILAVLLVWLGILSGVITA